MADLAKWRKNIPEGYDGRFGEQFDDEINPGEIIKISFGILVLVILSVIICLGLYRMMLGFEQPESKLPSPIAAANERQIPPTPLLQSHPEGEMAQLRAELAEHLSSFGWVDETQKVVRMPIDKAIDLVAAGHLPAPAGYLPTPSVDNVQAPTEENAPVPTEEEGTE